MVLSNISSMARADTGDAKAAHTAPRAYRTKPQLYSLSDILLAPESRPS